MSDRTEAKQKGWVVISMKNNWKRIFAFEQQYSGSNGPHPYRRRK